MVGDFTLGTQWISPWNLVDFNHEIWQISPVKSTQNYKSKCFSKNSSVWWMQGGGYDQGFHLWNPAEFTQISSMKSTQNYKSKCFSKNSSVWWMQGGGYDQGFHEICWISHEIHMKSTRFHEIHWISKLWAFAWWSSIGLLFFKRPIRRVFAETSDFIRFGVDFTWNPPDFMQISCEIKRPLARNCNPMIGLLIERPILDHHPKAHIHEIWQISWNLADFTMKSSRFHEIHEIQWISPWNLADFRWNQMFQKSDADVSAKTLLNLQGLGWISPEIHWISWNLPDFTWNPPDFMWNRKTFARNCNSMFPCLHCLQERTFVIHLFLCA